MLKTDFYTKTNYMWVIPHVAWGGYSKARAVWKRRPKQHLLWLALTLYIIHLLPFRDIKPTQGTLRSAVVDVNFTCRWHSR